MFQSSDSICYELLGNALTALNVAKPNERSEKARRYAVTITEMEKALAYFKTYVIDEKSQ